ncbi:hypothetical protein ACWDBO_31150 [Streptomyces mirabilis]|uniref:hypothetical protein n=1 Tax=Streptomyces mirabilis TaxID=68239 RepID=UPI00331BA671
MTAFNPSLAAAIAATGVPLSADYAPQPATPRWHQLRTDLIRTFRDYMPETAATKAVDLLDEVIAEALLEGEGERPSRFNATPSDVDHFLRRILAEDTYLHYQQAVGEQALSEAVEDAQTVRASADNDGLYNADWREGWDDAIQRVDPDHNGPCPSALITFTDEEAGR